MAIREFYTDPNGRRISREVPGYESPKPKTLPKENTMKTKQAVKKEAPKAKPAAPKQAREPKKPFKYAIMALNGDNVYKKKSEAQLDVDSELSNAFTKWLKSGVEGEFIAIRRG